MFKTFVVSVAFLVLFAIGCDGPVSEELDATSSVELRRDSGTIYAIVSLTPDRSATDVSVHCFGYMVGSDDYASGFMQVRDVVGGKIYRFTVDMDTNRALARPVRCSIDGTPEE